MTELYFLDSNMLPPDFVYPKEYSYLVGLELVDFDVWNFMDKARAESIILNLKNAYPARNYVPFAEQRGSDDIACWLNGDSNAVYIIENYTSHGDEVMGTYSNFWDWFNVVIPEMVEHIKFEMTVG